MDESKYQMGLNSRSTEITSHVLDESQKSIPKSSPIMMIRTESSLRKTISQFWNEITVSKYISEGTSGNWESWGQEMYILAPTLV